MKQISQIRTLYTPAGKAIVIAIVRNGCEARKYAHNFKRFMKLSELTMGWETRYFPQCIRFDNPSYVRNEG